MSLDVKSTESPAVDKVIRTETSLDLVAKAVNRAQDYLLKIQFQKGYWVGELEADASVAAGYIPLMHFLAGNVDPQKQQKIVNYVTGRQQKDGSWGTYYDGPGDLSVTIQVYFALKLAGLPSEDTRMQRARKFILARGGITRANVVTRIWLSLFGQFDWRETLSLPPEIILLPDWFYFNIYEFASWSRATIVALMVILTKKPVCPIPESARLSELYVEGKRHYQLLRLDNGFLWRTFFLGLDRFFKTLDRLHLTPARRFALKRAEKWITEHQEADGSWGGIMLPWVYSLIALKSLGYPLDHPVIVKGLRGLGGFIVEDDNTLRLQPATSPVWDTAWASLALNESGLLPGHPALLKAARWLLDEEVRVKGDWRIKNPRCESGCWAFEFDNDLYPDIDDTAVVARALRRVQLPEPDEARAAGAVSRGLCWVVNMQSNDGGWAAFDQNNDRRMLSHIPFGDFMTPLDPTSPDVTAHAIELLGEVSPDHPALKKGRGYLKHRQEADGAWYGRWGVNYIYGTGLALAGLQAAGEDMTQTWVRRAVGWLESKQNPDGGWGESCDTYRHPGRRGTGASTASQTAWALLGLLATGEQTIPAVEKGISYLLKTQQKDGAWSEAAYTGTGFPGAFYLRYDLYRIYFPLLALARYRNNFRRRG